MEASSSFLQDIRMLDGVSCKDTESLADMYLLDKFRLHSRSTNKHPDTDSDVLQPSEQLSGNVFR